MAKSRFSTGGGPSQRQLRVGELIRRTLSDVLARGDVHDPDLTSVSITVGEVRCSPDLKKATVYMLPLGGRDAEGVLAALRRNKPELRRMISKQMTLKYAPDLHFVIDDTFDRMDETRALFARDEVQRDVAERAGVSDAETGGDAGWTDREES
ncbi:MAG: 30S ribosome-binding factor RbfA [Pseudomonadota bacterium]